MTPRGPFNRKLRGRTAYSEKWDYRRMCARERDSNRSVVRAVRDTIEIALGNDTLAMRDLTVY